jgi:signal transduction histidine kinase
MLHSQTASPPSRSRPAKRILVVDDDTATRDSLSDILEEHGYEVFTSDDGREALARLRVGRADLILLDLRMPVMDGWKFRTLQRADPELSKIPVIAMSADGSPEAAAIHADHYLRKPFNADELLLTIERTFLARERQHLSVRLREAERIALLGTVAAGVGHEINNPLTYILGNLQLLETDLAALVEEAPSDERRAHLAGMQDLVSDITAGASRIAEVVRSLRWLARPEDDEHRPIDLGQVLESSIAIATNEIRHRARLETEIQPLPAIVGNAARLGQVFVNLLVNAAQAIPPGAADAHRIGVKTFVRDREVAVEVSDTGVGVRPELRQKIFEPFFTTKDPATGTGLGLAISRNIVDEHGGRIGVESAPGGGSLFRVILPIAPVQRAEHHPPAGTLVPPMVDGRYLRVLIVDDDPLVLATLTRMVGRGSTVVPVTTALAALEVLEHDQAFDAILCDLMMPEMTGMEFKGWLSSTLPELASRMVFMTGGPFAPEARQFLQQSSAPCLEKPFTPDALRAALVAVVEGASVDRC